MTLATPPLTARVLTQRRFHSGREWIASLGDIPLDRVIFDPWPGTATEADLLRYVERDKRLCELIDGTLVEKAVGFHQGEVGAELIGNLFIWNRSHGDQFVLAGADATLRMESVDRIRLPDVCAISRERLPNGKLPPEPVPALAPDLAVEILSPSNTRAEMRQKLAEYFGNGTRLAWLIDPNRRTVAVYTGASDEPDTVLTEEQTLTGGNLLVGFSVPLRTLFRDLGD